MAYGGVEGPIEGYNSLNEQDAAAVTPSSTASTTMLTANTTVLSYMDANYPIQYNYGATKWIEPYFDAATPKNVTALVGKSAYLNCRVRNLGNKTVSYYSIQRINYLKEYPGRFLLNASFKLLSR